MIDLRSTIRSIPDFPKKGIVFRDITTLLMDPAALHAAIDQIAARYAGASITKVVGIESRGFIIGGAVADRLGAGFVPIRKPKKLPSRVVRQEYTLEYGTDAIEMHADAITRGDRILMHDDLLATGGTMGAACSLVEAQGGMIVGVSFLIELDFLCGRKRLQAYDIHSLVRYETE